MKEGILPKDPSIVPFVHIDLNAGGVWTVISRSNIKSSLRIYRVFLGQLNQVLITMNFISYGLFWV